MQRQPSTRLHTQRQKARYLWISQETFSAKLQSGCCCQVSSANNVGPTLYFPFLVCCKVCKHFFSIKWIIFHLASFKQTVQMFSIWCQSLQTFEKFSFPFPLVFLGAKLSFYWAVFWIKAVSYENSKRFLLWEQLKGKAETKADLSSDISSRFTGKSAKFIAFSIN